MSSYFISLWYPLELGTFLISEDPPPNFELFPTETWDFFDFLTTPSPPIWTLYQLSPLFSLESFPYTGDQIHKVLFGTGIFHCCRRVRNLLILKFWLRSFPLCLLKEPLYYFRFRFLC